MTLIARTHHVRWMIQRDIERFLEIEALLSEPWDEAELLRYLRQRSYIAFAVDGRPGVMQGYAVIELFTDHYEIKRLAVDARSRRNGFGTSLVKHLKNKLSAHRRRSLRFDVPDTHDDMHCFLRSQAFKCVEVSRNAHFDGCAERDKYSFLYELGT